MLSQKKGRGNRAQVVRLVAGGIVNNFDCVREKGLEFNKSRFPTSIKQNFTSIPSFRLERGNFDPINIRFAQLITKLSRSKEFMQFFRCGAKSRSIIRIKCIYSAAKINEARKGEKKAAQIETGHELHVKALCTETSEQQPPILTLTSTLSK